MKYLLVAIFWAVAIATPLRAQGPYTTLGSPLYKLAPNSTMDMSAGTVLFPSGNITAPCAPGAVRISGNTLAVCNSGKAWTILPILNASSVVDASQLPSINLLTGTLTAGQLPGTVAANTTGNAATATALAAAPTQCASGLYANGIAASGNANCAQVAYSQLIGAPTIPSDDSQIANGAGYAKSASLATVATTGVYADLLSKPTLGTVASHDLSEFLLAASLNQRNGPAGLDGSGLLSLSLLPTIPSTQISGLGTAALLNSNVLVMASSLGAPNGVAQLDVNGKIPTTQIPTIAYSSLSGTPTIPTKLSQLTNDTGLVNATGAAAAAPVQSVAVNSGTAQTGAVNISVPTDNSQLGNGAGYAKSASLAAVATTGSYGSLLNLPTYGNIVTHNVSEFLSASLKDAEGGVAGLDSGGHVPLAEIPTLPAASTTTVGPVKVDGTSILAAGDGTIRVNDSRYDTAGSAASAVAAIPTSGPSTNSPALITPSDYSKFAGKQDAIGFTPQADPGVNGIVVRTGPGAASIAQSSDITNALGYTPENSANKGQPNGYAALDNTAHLASAQLPPVPFTDLSGVPNYVLQSSVGAPNGVATLNSAGQVPSSQIPPTPIATQSTTGAVKPDGTSIKIDGSGTISANGSLYDAAGAASTAVAAIPTSGPSQSRAALITPSDWATFNSKQNALGFTPENSANKGQPNGYASLDANGNLMQTATSVQLSSIVLPGCDSSMRGKMAFVPGSGASPDEFYGCLNTGGTYSWISLSSGGGGGSTTGSALTTFTNTNSVSWNEGMKGTNLVVSVWDNTGSTIGYSNFQIVDANTSSLAFAVSQSGTAKVTQSPYNLAFSGATSVSIPHNLNSLNIIPLVFDSNNNVIEPNSFQLVDANNAVMTFATPQSGTLRLYPITGTYSQSFTSATSVTVTHGLGVTQLAAAVYDGSNNLIGYNSLSPTDSNNATLTFATAQTGRIVVVAP